MKHFFSFPSIYSHILLKANKQQSLFKWGKTNCIQTIAVTERVQFKGRIDREQKGLKGSKMGVEKDLGSDMDIEKLKKQIDG